jgi:AcrR family transcriptional regulator
VRRTVALADAEGVAAVTIRRLATGLRVTPMALYWHFASKEELLDAAVDAVLAEVAGVRAAGPWQRRFAALIEALVAALRAHPWAVAAGADRALMREPGLKVTDRALDALRDGGFAPQAAANLARSVLHTVLGLVAGDPGPGPTVSAADVAEQERRTRQRLESVPADRYPRVVEAAAPLAACTDPDDYYRAGLDLLLAGVTALAHRSPGRSTATRA